MNKETRTYSFDAETQMRAITDKDGKRFIEGYGAVFNVKSRLIFDWDGEYYEIIREGAFDVVLESEDLDVIVTYNHDRTKILGRHNASTGHSTVDLSIDTKGLKYRVLVPNTPTGDEVYELIQRGDITESSFAFSMRQEDQEWDMNGDVNIRYINIIAGLYDVSPVWKGAYSETDTEVAKRHCKDAQCKLEMQREQREETKLDKATENELEATQDIDAMTVRMHELKD